MLTLSIQQWVKWVPAHTHTHTHLWHCSVISAPQDTEPAKSLISGQTQPPPVIIYLKPDSAWHAVEIKEPLPARLPSATTHLFRYKRHGDNSKDSLVKGIKIWGRNLYHPVSPPRAAEQTLWAACRAACKHLFISLVLQHTIAEKTFREQKGKERIKTYRSRDLIPPGFTKSLQDTRTGFAHNPWEGPAATHLTSTAQGWVLCASCTSSTATHCQVPSTGTWELLVLSTSLLQGKHLQKRRRAATWSFPNQAAFLPRHDFTTQVKG